MTPDQSVIDQRLVRILKSLAVGGVPRCSRADYMRLLHLPELKGTLQLENADGADSRGGKVLTDLHHNGKAKAGAIALLRRLNHYT
jgi:hypothetical protein